VSTVTGLVLAGAGLSETAGRLVPLLARRRRAASHTAVIGLLLAGTVVQALVFAVWPLAASRAAGLVTDGPAAAATWTAGSAAPLLLCAILAFPLLGPALHVVVLGVAGIDLAGQIATTTGLAWWPALACVAATGAVLALLLGGVRRAVGGPGTPP
jgi:hypothetical protein